MEFNRVKVHKVSESIAAQIEDLILEGSLEPGQRLPPERKLAQKLEVSRPSLREALVILEAKGLLEARRGGGTYVCDFIGEPVKAPLQRLLNERPEATFDILELRKALEESAAVHAAARHTEAERAILARRIQALREMPAEVTAAEEAAIDTDFHLAIADASHNVALVHVVRGLFDLLRESITNNLEGLHREPANRAVILGQHEAIYEAVAARDPDRARAAVHAHLDFVEARLRQLHEETRRTERARRRAGARTP